MIKKYLLISTSLFFITTFAHSNQLRHLLSSSDSTSLDNPLEKKWGLKTSNLNKAWNIHTGSRKVIVAIVDTGIDINHPDIKNNLWLNPGESGLDHKGRDKSTNGIDDDNNGYIDDINGWNFAHDNNQLTDNHGHGTHISGIIGAEGKNKFGVAGVSKEVSLMILKSMDPQQKTDSLRSSIRAFEYATKMNAHIINYSAGGDTFSLNEYKAIKKAEQKGILFVAAAGNSHANADIKKYYPASYNLDNIISVAAINSKLKLSEVSNFGKVSVDIAAPGEHIYSTHLNGRYKRLTGTSQATAFVSGLAALLMSYNQEFNARSVKSYILKTGDHLSYLKSKVGTAKKLNAYRALTMLDQGVGASGVVAENTHLQDSELFRTPANTNKNSANLKKFGNKLLTIINLDE